MDLPDNPKQLAPALERFLEVSGWSSMDSKQKMELAYSAYDLFSNIISDLKNDDQLADYLGSEITKSEEPSFFTPVEHTGPQDKQALQEQRLDLLKKLPCFQAASPWTQHLLAALCVVEEFRPDEPILTEFQPITGLYLIPGSVRISAFGAVLPLGQNSQLHGEPCSIPGEHRAAYNLSVESDQTGLYLSQDRLLSVLPWNPELRDIIELSAYRRYKSEVKGLTQGLLKQAEQGRLVQQVLDNIGQASFSIDEKGEIGNNYSVGATTHFGEKQLTGLPFADLILRDDRKALRAYYRALNMVFSGNQFDPKVVLGLLPNTAMLNGKSFRLTYHFAEDHLGFVVSVFVQMEDMTAELQRSEMEKQTHAREQEERLVQEKVRENIASFLSLLEMIEQNTLSLRPVLARVKAGDWVDETTKRILLKQLHSIKGLCSQFGLMSLRTAVHNVEGVLTAPSADQNQLLLSSYKNLDQQYRYAKSLIDSLGEKIVSVLMGVSFTQQEFSKLKKDLLQDNIASARMLVLKKAQVPASTLVTSWAEDIENIAHSLGKDIQFHLKAPENSFLPDDMVKVLNVELRHVYRNAIDHGVESPQKREQAGKPLQGNITCTLNIQGSLLHCEIEDDGNGIDWEVIKSKALENPRLDLTEVQGLIDAQEAWRILFLPGFSSQEEVSELSGRGVGMDAVAQSIERFKGTLGVSTTLGQGTRFWFNLPLII